MVKRRMWMKWTLLGCVMSLLCAPLLAQTREAVATVLGTTLYRDELAASPKGLGSLILGPLLNRFVQEQRLEATPAEIGEFQAALKVSDRMATATAAERAQANEISEAIVLDWKIASTLYRRYGGEVIFQQANPFEPVGALRQFLQEQEKSGAFAIHNAADRDQFYDYYVSKKHIVIPASEVDYDKPWWAQVPPLPGD